MLYVLTGNEGAAARPPPVRRRGRGLAPRRRACTPRPCPTRRASLPPALPSRRASRSPEQADVRCRGMHMHTARMPSMPTAALRASSVHATKISHAAWYRIPDRGLYMALSHTAQCPPCADRIPHGMLCGRNGLRAGGACVVTQRQRERAAAAAPERGRGARLVDEEGAVGRCDPCSAAGADPTRHVLCGTPVGTPLQKARLQADSGAECARARPSLGACRGRPLSPISTSSRSRA